MSKGRNQSLKARLQEFKNICKKEDIRITPQRLEIFDEIARAKDHPSAEELYKRVRTKMPTISFDTVYRTLATFENYGLLSKLVVFEDRTRFDPNISVHHHLICRECKRVEDFYWPTFEKLALPPQADGWGNVLNRQAHLKGLCKKCLKKSKKRAR
jgi:Fur family peroxide stress response transcriptional regulator